MNGPYSKSKRIEKFWEKVDKTGDCWEWLGAKDPKGYGIFSAGNKRLVRAHRFAYELFYGEIGNLMACHHCDNPSCVNPNHIFIGTAQDNTIDCIKKGRFDKQLATFGEINKHRSGAVYFKIHPSSISEIKSKYGSGEYRQEDLALEYGVTRQQISNIVLGKSRQVAA